MTRLRLGDADRELTAEQAAEAIAGQFPTIDVHGLRHLGSGWEFDAWATRDGWVFRFPRRRESATAFDREAALLDVVRPALQRIVALPDPQLRGVPSDAFPYPFAGHRMIPGVAADDPAAPSSVGLPRSLGRVLGRLHDIGRATARAAGCAEHRDGCAAWYRDVLALAGEISPTDDVVARGIAWLRGDPEVPRDSAGPLHLIHNDLCPDHLLVDPGSGELTGLIDWTDAALADPVLDFTVLLSWRGREFVEEVLHHYPRPFDRAARERLAFLARVQSLHWLYDAQTGGGDVAKHAGWVANAFAYEIEGRTR